MSLTDYFKSLGYATALSTVLLTGCTSEENDNQDNDGSPESAERQEASPPGTRLFRPLSEAHNDATAARPETYDIKSGDTFNEIATDFGLTPAQLKRANPQIRNVHQIEVGQTLKIPDSDAAGAELEFTTYTIKSGDSFYRIARNHGLDMDILQRHNPHIEKVDQIKPGQKLQIPVGVDEAAPPVIQSSSPKPQLSSTAKAQTCKPLLDFIGQIEAKGDYNCAYKHKKPSAVPGYSRSTKFTDMTLDEVMAWQRKFVARGSASSAVGKYQFLTKTLKDLKRTHGYKGHERFTGEFQDKLALNLAERRGLDSFLAGSLPLSDFMMNLAKEWASLPKDSGGCSYYDSTGINKALCTPAQIIEVLKATKAAAAKPKRGVAPAAP